jgi:glycosyltransferase involved in cell wall biosynthesis
MHCTGDNMSAAYFSVLMSVYHADTPSFLMESLESLFTQSLRPLEVVIVEDGPIPRALKEVIDHYRSKLNIISVRIEKNLGLAKALNIGLQKCSYDLVARMDADDICLPDRFYVQVRYMEANPDVSAASAWIEEFGEQRTETSIRRLPEGGDQLRRFARRRSPLSHPVSIFRREKILSVGGYPPFRNAQDYALWSSLMVKGYRLANIPKVLLRMRVGDNIGKKRSFRFLYHELMVLNFQRKIGFIGWADFLINSCARIMLRLAPKALIKYLYQHSRRS